MRRIIPSSAPWKMSGISGAKVTRDAEPDFRFERRTRQGIIVLRPQGTSRSEDLGGDPMSSHRARIVLLVAVFTLLSARADSRVKTATRRKILARCDDIGSPPRS